MRIAIANLRHLYQRRGLWIIYAVLILLVSLFVAEGGLSASKGEGLIGGFLVCSFLWGMLVATLQMETASKPFSFCLPGHRDAVRGLVFLAGLVVSLAFLIICVVLLASPSFPDLFERSLMPPELLIVVVGAYFFASMTAYLLGAGTALLIASTSTASLMVAVVAVCVLFDLLTTIQYPILHWPVAVMVLSLIAVVAGWWWLGRRAWIRRSCSVPWIGFFDPWDRRQGQRYRELYAARFTKNIPPEWDRFFQRTITACRLSSPGKYAWGILYTSSVLIVPQWKGLLSVALLAMALAAYFPSIAPVVMGVVSLMMTGFVQPPIGMTLLVAGGRRERFVAAVALLLAFCVVAVLLIGALVGLTHLLAPVVPPVTWEGYTLSPQALSLKVLVVPLVLLPIVGLMQVLFYRKPVRLVFATMLLVAFMMWSSAPFNLYRAVTPLAAVLAAILTWGLCLSLLYRIAMHRDLVRQ